MKPLNNLCKQTNNKTNIEQNSSTNNNWPEPALGFPQLFWLAGCEAIQLKSMEMLCWNFMKSSYLTLALFRFLACVSFYCKPQRLKHLKNATIIILIKLHRKPDILLIGILALLQQSPLKWVSNSIFRATWVAAAPIWTKVPQLEERESDLSGYPLWGANPIQLSHLHRGQWSQFYRERSPHVPNAIVWNQQWTPSKHMALPFFEKVPFSSVLSLGVRISRVQSVFPFIYFINLIIWLCLFNYLIDWLSFHISLSRYC